MACALEVPSCQMEFTVCPDSPRMQAGYHKYLQMLLRRREDIWLDNSEHQSQYLRHSESVQPGLLRCPAYFCRAPVRSGSLSD